MSVLGRIVGLRSNPLENPLIPISSPEVLRYLGGEIASTSGVRVNEKTALRHITVLRCVELIAGTCAGVPLKAFEKPDRRRIDVPVIDEPHPELTRFELWELVYVHLLLWGNAYLRKLRNGAGQVVQIWPIHPGRVDVELIDPSTDNAGGKVFAVEDKNGRRVPYTSYEILHIPGIGYDGIKGLSRIRYAAQGIGTAMAADEYASRLFTSGSLHSGILTTDKALQEGDADRLKARWREKVGAGLAGAHDIAVLDNGATFKEVSMPADDAQLLESRKWGTNEITRLFGVAPFMVGDVEKSTSWGTGIEQQKLGLVQFTLAPSYLGRVEQRVTKHLMPSPSRYAEYILEGLLRGDAKTRAAFYTAMVQIRAMNPNEVRVRENLEPYEGGDEFINPNITQPVDTTDDTIAPTNDN